MKRFLALVVTLWAGIVQATVTGTVTENTYACNGSQTAYPTTFRFLAGTDLAVAKTTAGVTSALALTTDYTVTGAKAATGTVTLTAGSKCPSGSTLTITRTLPMTQGTAFRSQGSFSPALHEDAFDRLAMVDQQLSRDDGLARADIAELEAFVNGLAAGGQVVIPKTWTLAGDGTAVTFSLPAADLSSAASYYVTIDGLSQIPTADFSVSGGADTITFTSAPPVGSVIEVRCLTYAKAQSVADATTVTATGSTTARSLADRFAEAVSVKDYGAKCDGVSNDAPAINAALATGKPALLPAGSCVVKAPLSIPSGGGLVGAGRATVLVVPSDFVGPRVITNADIANGNTSIALAQFSIRNAATTAPVQNTDGHPGIIRLEKVDGLSITGLTTDTFASTYMVIDLAKGCRNVVVSGNLLKNTQASSSGGALQIRAGEATDGSGASDAFNITVQGNVLSSAYDEAFVLYGWFNTIRNVTVSGNVIVNTGSSTQNAVGILGYNAGGQTGVVQDITLAGNFLSGRTNILTGAKRVGVVGNAISGPTTGSLDAILINEYTTSAGFPTSVAVIGNSINGATRYGIFSGATDTVIHGNRISGTSDNCINGGAYIEDNVVVPASGKTGVFASGSKVIAHNRSIGGANGIAVFGTTSNLALLDNTIIDPSTNGVSLNVNGGTMTNVLLLRNQVRGDTVTPTNGIRAFDGSTGGTWVGCAAEGNRVYGATTNYATFPAGWRKAGNWTTTSNTSFPIISGTNAQRPTSSLGADDAGFLYRSTDAAGLLVWTGSGWVKASDNTSVP